MLQQMFRRVRASRFASKDPETGKKARLKRYAVRPSGWKEPRGYENGVLVEPGGHTLFVAGQIAWNEEHELVGKGDMSRQFVQALDNVITVVREAGGIPEEIVRMTVYVTDKTKYLDARSAIGMAWEERLGRHYPAMALVEVSGLLEKGAEVEIEATAVIG